MDHKHVFYYRFNRFNLWTGFNLSLFIVLCVIFLYKPWALYCLTLGRIYIVIFIFSYILWRIKYLKKHIMAIITDKTIRIDTCNPLNWEDVDYAEIRTIRCCYLKKKIIVLVPKQDIKYDYNFLQKHNGEFTPFSIPLYDIVLKEDIEEIKSLIRSHVKDTRF